MNIDILNTLTYSQNTKNNFYKNNTFIYSYNIYIPRTNDCKQKYIYIYIYNNNNSKNTFLC